MYLQFIYQDISYQFDSQLPIDISLPIRAGRENPNCYYAESPKFEVIRAGDFVGSVAEGGSVNYQKITFTPHGNGTHTECYGHISADIEAVLPNCLKESLFFAELITVEPQSLGEDLIISLAQIKAKIKTRPQALIIRTLPNAADKKTKQYSNTSPPYLLAEIGSYLAEIGVKHLLIDLPSVDRESDGGVLAMHHAFWQLPHQIRKDCTITELIYVSDEVQDGIYVLNLQTAHFELDAVPSKPVLYKVLSQKY